MPAANDGSPIKTRELVANKLIVGTSETGVTTQAAATGALTNLTHTAPGTADYAIQDLVQPAGYGFVSKDEGNTVLKVVQANKVRIAEIIAALQAFGLMA